MADEVSGPHRIPGDLALPTGLPRPERSWFVRPDGYDASGTIHGLAHTLRVMIHTVEIAQALRVADWERETVLLAALWHDVGRTDDGRDPLHGAKSAGKLVGLGLHRDVPRDRLPYALLAVTHHSGDDRHGEQAALRLDDPEAARRIFHILKDADGLDRVRLGDLRPSMLRLPGSAGRVARAEELLRRIP